MTSLRISEIFESTQGEGPSAGTPATFLRLSGCNLACRWCDTEYSWNWKKFDKARFEEKLSISATLARLGRPARLIVTGGEPLLQIEALERLLGDLPRSTFVEVESNATVRPSDALLARVDQWNLSPKLSNSGEPLARRLRRDVLDAFRTLENAWLKLVVEGEHEDDEVKALLRELDWPKTRVYLQPQVVSRERLRDVGPAIADWSARAGHGYSPRLHIEWYDGERGR